MIQIKKIIPWLYNTFPYPHEQYVHIQFLFLRLFLLFSIVSPRNTTNFKHHSICKLDNIFKNNNAEYMFILFTNNSARVGYDTRSIFKRSLTGLNSDFSFS